MESLEKYRVGVGVNGEEFTDGCVTFLWRKMWVGRVWPRFVTELSLERPDSRHFNKMQKYVKIMSKM